MKMNIFENDGQLWTTSLDIADMLGKDHKTILRDFRRKAKEISQLDAEYQLVPSEYKDSTGRKLPMYLLNEMMMQNNFVNGSQKNYCQQQEKQQG